MPCCGWDGASLPEHSRAVIQGFLHRHLLKQSICVLCKLSAVHGQQHVPEHLSLHRRGAVCLHCQGAWGDVRGEARSHLDLVAEGLLRSVHGVFLTLHCMKPLSIPHVSCSLITLQDKENATKCILTDDCNLHSAVKLLAFLSQKLQNRRA